jgi:hypothetical protein
MEKFISMPLVALAIILFILSAKFENLKAVESNDLSIGTVSYLSYETILDPDDGLQGGAFKVNRSYLTVKKQLMKNLGFRITVDASQDETGDFKARLKYVYALFTFDDFYFITKPNIEVGMAHAPWLDFEEHINYYRMQGTMFVERAGLFNSADLGFTVAGYLGGEMDDEYKKKVNKKYAGKYGSFAFGLYNGGGYHAKEANGNKVFEGRLTVRPLPEIIPGLQLSYFGIFGQGNKVYGTDSIPDWQTNVAMLSYEHQYFTITGQYVSGKGNQKGDFVQNTYEATGVSGFSGFAEIKPDENWRGIFRFDNFDSNTDLDNNESQRMIVGIGYDFGGHNVLILDYDKKMYKDELKDDEDKIKLTMQINF